MFVFISSISVLFCGSIFVIETILGHFSSSFSFFLSFGMIEMMMERRGCLGRMNHHCILSVLLLCVISVPFWMYMGQKCCNAFRNVENVVNMARVWCISCENAFLFFCLIFGCLEF